MTVPQTAGEVIDLRRLRRYRLSRVRAQLRAEDCAAAVLMDPVNIRYATDSRNMSVWCLHNPTRYCFVPADGPVILFEFHGCGHLAADFEAIDEIRPARSWTYFVSGPRVSEHVRGWAAELADLVASHGGGNRRIAIDRCEAAGVDALRGHGLEITDGQALMERARLIKSADEIACMTVAIAAAEDGLARMREALRPGITEQQLWSLLHQANIEHGGEWIETRLLSSGQRTNPWMQECSDRKIEAGDLVSLDTDLIGPFGYCADISRCFFTEPGTPTAAQRELFRLAHEQIHYNMELLRPDLSFRELAERAWPIPAAYADNRYSCVLHGVGLCDEYPMVAHDMDFDKGGYDGRLKAGMTVCVESYIGERDGAEGVKLEQQMLVTDSGAQTLSQFPFEPRLLVALD